MLNGQNYMISFQNLSTDPHRSLIIAFFLSLLGVYAQRVDTSLRFSLFGASRMRFAFRSRAHGRSLQPIRTRNVTRGHGTIANQNLQNTAGKSKICV